MADMKTYYATKPFWWAGKNIPVGGDVKMNKLDAAGMLHRGAVTEAKPKTARKAAKDSG